MRGSSARLPASAGTAALAARWVLGWIYWGGGSRRLIYAPSKLDPNAPHWLAGKFQSALPGALLGSQAAGAALLAHPVLLHGVLVAVSVLELLAGVSLLLGILTRAGALASIALSLALMPLFGWQGASCIDEWTMSASTLALGVVVYLVGGGTFALDRLLFPEQSVPASRRHRLWASASWSEHTTQRAGAVAGVLVLAWVVAFYAYYRGSVWGPYHPGPVSPKHHALTLSGPVLHTDGAVELALAVTAGTPAAAAHIIGIAVIDGRGKPIEEWGGRALSRLPAQSIGNRYPYQRIGPGVYGLKAPVGAQAMLHLAARQAVPPGNYRLVAIDISGRRFGIAVTTTP